MSNGQRTKRSVLFFVSYTETNKTERRTADEKETDT